MAAKMNRKKVETETVENVVKEEAVTEKAVTPKEEKKVFSPEEGARCRSMVLGGLFVEGPKTGMIYRFIDYDDICEIEYRDLIALVRGKSVFIYNPYMIVDDEDFIKENPQLKKFYEDQYSIKDLKNILKEDDISVMSEKIKRLPTKEVIDSLRHIAADMVDKGAIDSISKIRVLNELLDTELSVADSIQLN